MSGAMDPWAAGGFVPQQGAQPVPAPLPPAADPWAAGGFTPVPQAAQAAPQAAAGAPGIGPSGDAVTDTGRFLGSAGANTLAAVLSMPRGIASGIDYVGRHTFGDPGLAPALGSIATPGDPSVANGGRPLFPNFQQAQQMVDTTTGAPNYVPASRAGRMAQAGVTGGLLALTGNPEAIPGAVGGSMTSQVAGEMFPNHPLVAALAGFLPGAMAAQKLGQLAVNPATSAAEVNPQLARTLQDAQALGVKIPAPSVASNKFWGTALDQSSRLPFSGAESAQDANQVALNRGVATAIGAPNAGTVTRMTPDVMQAAKDANSAGYDDVLSRTTVPVDDQMMSDLQAVIDRTRLTTSADSVKPVENQVDNILATAGNNDGELSGRQWKDLTAKGGPVDGLLKSTDTGLNQAGAGIRQALADALSRNATPVDAAKLAQLDAQWKAMRTFEAPIERAGATGNVSGPSLMGAVQNGYNNLAYDGAGLPGQLARVGQLLKAPPSSETANRELVNHLMTAGAAGLGAGAGEAAGGHLAALGAAGAGFVANRLANAAMRSPILTKRLINAGLNGGPALPSPSMALIAQQLMRTSPQFSATSANSGPPQ